MKKVIIGSLLGIAVLLNVSVGYSFCMQDMLAHDDLCCNELTEDERAISTITDCTDHCIGIYQDAQQVAISKVTNHIDYPDLGLFHSPDLSLDERAQPEAGHFFQQFVGSTWLSSYIGVIKKLE